MGNARNIDAAISKGEFFCVKFPEQYQMWVYKSPWDRKPFDDHKLTISAVSVKSSKPEGESSFIYYGKKNPWVIKGVDVSGKSGMTTQNRTAIFGFRVDSIKEFNDVMSELSQVCKFEIWDVASIEVYNNNLGASLEFIKHNPNGLGVNLYLYRAKTSEFEKSYQNINLFDQERLFNNFHDNFAACTMVSRLVPGCALQARKEKSKHKK